MTTTPSTDREHPLSVLVARVHEELNEAVELPVWSLGQAEAAATLTSLTRLAARVAALELRVAAQAREVVVEDVNGATSTATWWAHETRSTRAVAHRKITLAAALGRHRPTAVALASGGVLADQAGVIIDALAALPDHVEAAVKEQAETHLLDLAADFDAKALRRLGKGILETRRARGRRGPRGSGVGAGGTRRRGRGPVHDGRRRARPGPTAGSPSRRCTPRCCARRSWATAPPSTAPPPATRQNPSG